jgi:hypothetical protein
MKSLFTLVLLSLMVNHASAQKNTTTNTNNSTGIEQYGNTINLAGGIGYYGYIGSNPPVLHFNFEIDVAKNLTLAPFITYYSYNNYYYWGNPNNGYRDYRYRTTVIPIGVKGTYYFDQLLGASSKWDFYLAASLGFAFRKTTWESSYYGERTIQNGSSGLYLDGHIGAEYHLNNKLGLFLDLSSGISTFGLGIHL